jgi:hypothetical protein
LVTSNQSAVPPEPLLDMASVMRTWAWVGARRALVMARVARSFFMVDMMDVRPI